MNRQPVIYLLAGAKSYLVGLAPYPEIEAKYYLTNEKLTTGDYKLYQLTEIIPWGIGDYLYRGITKEQERKWPGADYSISQSGLLTLLWTFQPRRQVLTDKINQLKELTAGVAWEITVCRKQIQLDEIKAVSLPAPGKCRQVYELIKGRKLYLTEIRQAVRKQGGPEAELDQILTYLRLTDRLEIKPAVKYQNREFVCQRCNSKEVVGFDCGRCNRRDYYCQDCNLLGEARLCRALYVIPGTSLELKLRGVTPKWEIELTKLQREVADQLLNVWYKSYQRGLVWAVCGAGKTEVTFDLIAEVLSQGGKVLFAIPRREIVIELAARLRAAFPKVNIKALYGGSQERYQPAELVVATTHQLLRYHRAFELVILDERDAFPYQGSKMLQRAIKEVQKPVGKFVALTATPTREQVQAVKQDKQGKLIKLCARYHGYPLPEPELITAELTSKPGEVELPPVVFNKLELSIQGKLAQVFLFVPTRKLVEVVTAKLRDYFPRVNGRSWVQGTHAEDKARREKREEFLAGEYPILVTTTVMERGITVKKANVLVLFADADYVFDESALVQMAGRSGRSPQYPTGQVWFIAASISREMKAAKQMIRELNEEAEQRGYLIK